MVWTFPSTIGSCLLRQTLQAVDVSDLAESLATLWDNLWHAQVSDSSGVNSWLGEVLFGIRQNALVLQGATTFRDTLLTRLGWTYVSIDLAQQGVNAVTERSSLMPTPTLPPASAPVVLEMSGEGRTFEVQWFEVGTGHYKVVIDTTAASVDPGCETCDFREIVAAWPRSIDRIRYSPGLSEDIVVDYPFGAFDFLSDEVYLPLSSGLIAIGEDVWVIKDVRTTHIAARIGPANSHVEFIDRALQQDDEPRWTFYLVVGDAVTALAVANTLNIHPTVQY